MSRPRPLPWLVPIACCSSAAQGQNTAAVVQADIRDIRGSIEVHGLPPFAMSGGALLLVVGLFLAHRHLRRNVQSEMPLATGRPHLRDRLARLADDYRQERCSGDELIVRLDSLVRDALTNHAGIVAQRLTSAELRRQTDASGVIGEVKQVQFAGFLSLCDRVKFAGHHPAAAEIDEALSVAAALLDSVESEQGV